METHSITIAKATQSDFEKIYNLLLPMEQLFNGRFLGEHDWENWPDDDKDKQELLLIRKRIAEDEGYSEDEIDNRIVIYKFIRSRMHACRDASWQRVVVAAESLINTFCDPQKDYLACRPDIERAMENTMLGE